MQTENLIAEISFEGLEDFGYSPLVTARSFRSFGFGPRNERLKKKGLQGYAGDIYSDTFAESFSSGLGLDYGAAEKSDEPIMGFSETQTDSRPRDVILLEKLLATSYRNPLLKITGIEALPVSRKEVKRVHFTMGSDVYQVWVYKADPKETARELAICQIVNNNGIPTARPIGYNSGDGEEYPYDIAVLGGVVEHAGEPYDQLLESLRLSPNEIFRTAKSIAHLLADFHVKLTNSKRDFENKGISLERANPRKEILERMVAALNLEERKYEPLMSSCEDLYEKQEGSLLVSHGDIHTKNIVTSTTKNPKYDQFKTSLINFGIIDYGSVCLDYSAGDVVDFWTHHMRKALEVCIEYNFDIDGVRREYEREFVKVGSELGVNLNHGSSRNFVIQSALWNVYEMFDPLRRNSSDSVTKARFHLDAFLKSQERMEEVKCGAEFFRIKQALNDILEGVSLNKFFVFT